MSDLISRQDAIEAIAESLWHHPNALYPAFNEFDNCIYFVKDVVKRIPPANQWIPCSERLPKKDGHYIVYAPTYSGGSSSSKEHHDGVMFSAFKKGKWSIEHGYHKRPNCVVAWQPLPKPWKGEKK